MHRGEAFPVIDMAEGRERGIAGSWVLDASGELRQRTGSGPQQPLTQGQPAGGGGKAGGVPQQPGSSLQENVRMPVEPEGTYNPYGGGNQQQQQQQAPNINQSAAAGIQGAMAGAGREMNYRPMNVGATGYNAAQGGATGYGAARRWRIWISRI
jgi:hypothetical protein